jgi:hypothetical protein
LRRLVLIAIVAVLAGGAVAALGAAVTHTRTASSGSTVATLSWTANHSTTGLPYSNLRLDIRRGGSDLFDDPVHGLLCGTGCWPALGVRSAPVVVSDIEGDGAPDVIVSLYSGGAHCCYVTQIYRYDPGTQTYSVAQRDFGDPGSILERIGGAFRFRSADDRFAYRFAAFAFSGLPVQIWRFTGGRFVDVTRHYPGRIAADAAVWWSAFEKNAAQHFGDGFIAAWAADEDLLGRGALVSRTLAAQNRAGRLRNTGVPGGTAFVGALERFLAHAGYS